MAYLQPIAVNQAESPLSDCELCTGGFTNIEQHIIFKLCHVIYGSLEMEQPDTFHTRLENTLIAETYHSTIELIPHPQSVVAVLKRARRSDQRTKAKWRNEVSILNMVLSQPHLSQILDSKESDLSILLRHEPGLSLDKCVYEDTLISTLSASDAAAVWSQMASALDYLHTHSIVHDDVKPENIVWHSNDQRSVLLDFGAAIFHPDKATVDFVPSGTPPYAPPEFLKRQKGPEGDIWALAVTILFAMGFIKLPDGEWILPHALEGREDDQMEMMAWLAEMDAWRVKLQSEQPVIALMLEADPGSRISSARVVEKLRV